MHSRQPGSAATARRRAHHASCTIRAPAALLGVVAAGKSNVPPPWKPAIILVEPIMGENIGAAARAMKNFGLTDLRLVAPTDGWPNAQAETVASNAQDVLHAARVFDTLDEAIADLTYLYAATARPRFMNKDYILSQQLHQDLPTAGRVGIMFGQEKSGLTNADVARADKIVTIDANPEYPVLNLAQSVVLLVYELYCGSQEEAARQARRNRVEAGGPQGDCSTSSSSVSGDLVKQEERADWGPTRHERGQQTFAISSAGVPQSAVQSDEPEAVASGLIPLSSLRPDLTNDQLLCSKGELESFLTALESELAEAKFFESDAKKKASVSVHLRDIFTRIPKLNKAEVSMLRGALSKLTAARRASTEADG